MINCKWINNWEVEKRSITLEFSEENILFFEKRTRTLQTLSSTPIRKKKIRVPAASVAGMKDSSSQGWWIPAPC